MKLQIKVGNHLQKVRMVILLSIYDASKEAR